MLSLIFPAALLLMFAVLFWRLGRRHAGLLPILVAAFGLRLAFAVLNVIGFVFPFSNTTDIDAFLSHAEGMTGGALGIDVSQSYVWAGIIGIINYYTGDIALSPLVLNMAAGVASVHCGILLCHLALRDRTLALRVGWVLAVLPPLVFISATYLRDAATTF